MAQCVGTTGQVVAIEVDEALAENARTKLSPWPHVEVRHGDGTTIGSEPFDAILVNAGVTHPEPVWLSAISAAVLIFPLTCAIGPMGPIGKGFLVKASRRGEDLDAAMIGATAIYSAVGIRSSEINARLGDVLRRNPFPSFKRLRRDVHDESPSCWLHTSSFCLSA